MVGASPALFRRSFGTLSDLYHGNSVTYSRRGLGQGRAGEALEELVEVVESELPPNGFASTS
jgi:hypothetical protein